MVLQHFWAKTGLRGQFVFLFLLISLVPLIIVSLLAYYYGVSALENTIGENLGQIAKEKLVRADRSILDRLSKIVFYIESLAPAVSQANGKNSSELPLTVVLLQINNELKDDIRQLEGILDPTANLLTQIKDSTVNFLVHIIVLLMKQ